jgi:hypothetical protein
MDLYLSIRDLSFQVQILAIHHVIQFFIGSNLVENVGLQWLRCL